MLAYAFFVRFGLIYMCTMHYIYMFVYVYNIYDTNSTTCIYDVQCIAYAIVPLIYLWMSVIVLLVLFAGFGNLTVWGRCCQNFLDHEWMEDRE
jgi:hypothetical protein